jgi:hypothetical protein
VLTINVANFSIADWKGDKKKTYETGYGIKLGIYTTARRAAGWKPGCSVSSSVLAARRGKFEITFVAIVSAAEAVVAQASAQAMTPATLIAAVQQAAATLKASGEITTDPKIFSPTEMESLSKPTIAVAPTAAPTAAPVTTSSSADGSAVIIIVVVCVIVCVIAGVGGAFYYFHNRPQQDTVAVKGANIGVEMDVAASNAPPPGAVYMKNGQWLDKNDKPVGQQPEQQI